jgi:RNA polymerase sigma-70 factor (ECF subfamily)
LYRRYGARVYRIAYRLTGRPEDAEDVLQDVFLGLPEALRSYAARGSFAGWLHRVAARTALMRLRSARRRRETPLAASRPALPAAGVVDRLAIEAAMASLPEPLRIVFVLREIEGYSHAEIGELLGIRAGASKVRLHRARRALRGLLGSRP